jgi:hypothetical protein
LRSSCSGAVGAGSYWLGTRSQSASAGSRRQRPSATADAPKPRKLLYYRNPMGLADTSPTPKKDPMGMDYIAVYEGEDESAPAGSRRCGVTEPGPHQHREDPEARRAHRGRGDAPARRTVRAAGRIEPDERRVFVIAPKFEGYVERCTSTSPASPSPRASRCSRPTAPSWCRRSASTPSRCRALEAMKDAGAEAQAGMRQLAESSLARLRNWDLSPAQVTALMKSGQVQRTIAFHRPCQGVVTEKKALQGMRFMPGEMLYQVTDLSSVWVIADLSEQDIGRSRPAPKAVSPSRPTRTRCSSGRITYVYPTLKADTRSVPVRVELANPGQRLKPAMFAQVELAVGGKSPVLTVPDSAVIDTGTRRLVLVQVGEGRFEPREVELGAAARTSSKSSRA